MWSTNGYQEDSMDLFGEADNYQENDIDLLRSSDYTNSTDMYDTAKVIPPESGRGTPLHHQGRRANPDIRSVRTPERFRERVRTIFRSRNNISYLKRLFARTLPKGRLKEFALDTLYDTVISFGQFEDLIYSDPLAQRGDLRPTLGLWSEVRRLNRALYEYRMKFIRDNASLIEGVTGDGLYDDNEPYHYRMFVADSLRPPGLEKLNNTGPLYGIREDTTAFVEKPYSQYRNPAPALPKGFRSRRRSNRTRRESFTPNRESPPSNKNNYGEPIVGASPEDWAWENGDPNRTAEQAVAEYWGEGQVASDYNETALGSMEIGGKTHGEVYAEGDNWRENGGTRFMRYPTIPFWQNLSHRGGYDYDIEETLGSGSRELDNHVRRWDMSRLRHPRGEENRRYGWRSGNVV